MKKILLITFLLFALATNASAAVTTNSNTDSILKETDNFELILEKNGEEIILNEYTNQDSIEAILYDDFIIYNGNQGGIGLYLYDIETNESYLLNDPGDFQSAIFYYNFNEKNNKLYVKVGIELASMPKICVYDLKKLSEVLTEERGQIEEYLEAESETKFAHLYNFTDQNKISYCTLNDEKYYYEVELLEDDKIRYTTCKESICEEEGYVGGEVYESDWDGEDKELIKVIGESQSKKWLGIDIPVLIVFGIVAVAIIRKRRNNP